MYVRALSIYQGRRQVLYKLRDYDKPPRPVLRSYGHQPCQKEYFHGLCSSRTLRTSGCVQQEDYFWFLTRRLFLVAYKKIVSGCLQEDCFCLLTRRLLLVAYKKIVSVCLQEDCFWWLTRRLFLFAYKKIASGGLQADCSGCLKEDNFWLLTRR